MEVGGGMGLRKGTKRENGPKLSAVALHVMKACIVWSCESKEEGYSAIADCISNMKQFSSSLFASPATKKKSSLPTTFLLWHKVISHFQQKEFNFFKPLFSNPSTEFAHSGEWGWMLGPNLMFAKGILWPHNKHPWILQGASPHRPSSETAPSESPAPRSFITIYFPWMRASQWIGNIFKKREEGLWKRFRGQMGPLQEKEFSMAAGTQWYSLLQKVTDFLLS